MAGEQTADTRGPVANTDYRGMRDPIVPVTFEQFMLERAGTAGMRPTGPSVFPNPGTGSGQGAPSWDFRMRQREQMNTYLRGTSVTPT